MAVLNPEKEIQKEAFENYYTLRSYRKVAEKLALPVSTVKEWCRRYKWVERALFRDADNVRVDTENKGEVTSPIMIRYRQVIDMIMERVADKIESGELEIKTVEDLERVVKLDLLLMGEATNRVEKVSVIELPEEIRNLLDAKIESLKQKNS